MHRQEHILSVNLEDYFQVAPMRQVIPHRYWPRFERRVEKSALSTLDLLDRHGAKATFFVVGWLAEQNPDLLAEVARRGHEVASKGYLHRNFSQMSLNELRDDFRRSRDVIENATGKKIIGYRIAEGSLPADDVEPYRMLAQEGVKYDSSLRPFGARFISRPDLRRTHEIKGEDWSIMEVPLSSDTLLGVPYPVTGGNYMRQLPRSLHENRVTSWHAKNDAPWHFYFHSWELDPEQPRVSATTRLSRMRQYRNLDEMRARIETWLERYSFRGIAETLEFPIEEAPARVPSTTVPIRIDTHSSARDVKSVTIVTPCYNEEETLPYLASTLASVARDNADVYKFSYVFVDDGSKDGTWEKLNELFGRRDDVQLIRHKTNRGIAAATMTGIRAAKDEIVCGIDCDCSFDPHLLAEMIPLLKQDVDMVQASPYHRNGGVMNVPAWRLALSKGVCMIYQRILNHAFSSYTACFRVYRRSKMLGMKLDDEGFMGIMEIFVRLDQSKAHIVEFPAVLETRLIGQSKMKVLRVIRNHLGLIRRLVTERRGESSFSTSIPSPANGSSQYGS